MESTSILTARPSSLSFSLADAPGENDSSVLLIGTLLKKYRSILKLTISMFYNNVKFFSLRYYSGVYPARAESYALTYALVLGFEKVISKKLSTLQGRVL